MTWIIFFNICLGNGLSPVRCQAIASINGDLLLIVTIRTNYSEILVKHHTLLSIKYVLRYSPQNHSTYLRPHCVNWQFWTNLFSVGRGMKWGSDIHVFITYNVLQGDADTAGNITVGLISICQ